MWVDVPLRVSMAMREVKECDRAERALEASKKQMEKCEKECKILRKDVSLMCC